MTTSKRSWIQCTNVIMKANAISVCYLLASHSLVVVLSDQLTLDEFKHTKAWRKRYSFRCSILNGNIYNHNDLIRVQMWNAKYIMYYPDFKKEPYERDMETITVINTLNNAWNSIHDIYIQGQELAKSQKGTTV